MSNTSNVAPVAPVGKVAPAATFTPDWVKTSMGAAMNLGGSPTSLPTGNASNPVAQVPQNISSSGNSSAEA